VMISFAHITAEKRAIVISPLKHAIVVRTTLLRRFVASMAPHTFPPLVLQPDHGMKQGLNAHRNR
jgi:hypothetical protein